MISVIMPVYNRQDTVCEAIKSVLDQTYRDLEMIVIDDGSTDNTKKAVSSIHDPRLKYIYQHNAGACVARNNGVSKSNGQFIAFQDSDDIWHLDKMQKQIKILDRKNADLVFCKLIKCYPDGKTQLLPDSIGDGFLSPVENLFGIGTQSLLARREVFETCPFDISMPRFQEFEMLIRIADKYKLYCLNEGLVDYKIGTDSISNNPEKLYKACEMILLKHPDFRKRYPKMMHVMASALQDTGIDMKKNNVSDYKKYFERCLKYDCSIKRRISVFVSKMF
ncbi:MAG: glycosyltransferase family 2 protein [Lachnospiraceae bacterium]